MNKRPDKVPTRLRGVYLHHFPVFSDARGGLTVGEFGKSVPFAPSRYFLVFGVPAPGKRGEHAHLRCHQFLVATRGRIRVTADDGIHREEFLLDHPGTGLHLPPLIWGVQEYLDDAALLVFASDPYDATDYVHDYDNFRRQARAQAPAA